MMGRIIVFGEDSTSSRHQVQCPVVRMGGLVRCRTYKYKSGTLKYDTGWFPNIITDLGVGYYANAPLNIYGVGAIFAQCAVGTGTGTPTKNDTALFTYLTLVGSGQTDSTAVGYVAAASPNPPYYWNQNTFTFPTGAAAGNLTEIGVFPYGVTYGSGLFSHALIVDVNGNPTSITVLADEVLTVTYQVNYYIDTTDHAFSFPYNGATTTGIYRIMTLGTTPSNIHGGGWQTGLNQFPQIGFYSGDIGSITGQNTGTQLAISNINNSRGTFSNWTNDLVNTGTWYFDYLVTIPAGTGTGTILSMNYNFAFMQYQFGNLSTPVTKTSGQQLQVSFRTAWGRYP